VSSVVQKVILHAHVPMMIVRAHASPATDIAQMSYRRVLVPLDGSQRAECALPLAKKLANFHNSQLLLVHAVVRPEIPRHTPFSEEEQQLVDRLKVEPDEGGQVPETTTGSAFTGCRNTRHRR
jgi:nucleotide-binding universal stress UspA family protein